MGTRFLAELLHRSPRAVVPRVEVMEVLIWELPTVQTEFLASFSGLPVNGPQKGNLPR